MSLEYKFESLEGSFPRDLTPAHRRESSPFGKSWTQVQELLEKELRMLGYRRGSVVLQTAHSPWDVRKDGKLRSDVRRPEHPGVVLKFDRYDRKTSRYVPMQFNCDCFTEWKANIRGIADGLEALRKINRYGVFGGANSEAHYEGYKALPPADSKSEIQPSAEFLQKHGGNGVIATTLILQDRAAFEGCYRIAVQRLHPDKPTGSHELFIQLQKSKEILEKHFNK